MASYNVEDLIISQELKQLDTVSKLMQWAIHHRFSDHPIVLGKLEKMMYEELRHFNDVTEVKRWAAQNNVDQHRLVLERIDYLESSAALEIPAKQEYIQTSTKRKHLDGISSAHTNEETFSVKKLKPIPRKHPCSKCTKDFDFVFTKNRHERKCSGPALPLQNHKCEICKARFVNAHDLDQHNSIHQPVHRQMPVHRPREVTTQSGSGPIHRPWEVATQSGTGPIHRPWEVPTSEPLHRPWEVPRELQRPNNDDLAGAAVGKMTRCRECQEVFCSRRAFYIHRMIHHQQQGNGDLQPMPWDRAPWVDDEGNEDEDLKTIFKANAPFINAPHKPGDVRETYNYPLNNDINTEDIIEKVKEIFSIQQRAFKINFMFGLILRHVDTGELRYFIPDLNETLLDQPILINKPRDITLKLRRILNGKDLAEYMLRQRSDSKWRPVFMTNLKMVIFKSNFLLGCTTVELPEYVKKNRNICSLMGRPGKPYKDNLCAFRCLATHRGFSSDDPEFTTTVNTFYKYWQEFLLINNLGDLKCMEPSNYTGVNFQELDIFESCFNINVYIYTLKEDGSAEVFHRSLGQHKDSMYLNVYDNHLSYITNINAYSKKFQCRSCNQFFPSSKNISIHERRCEGKTMYRYPGGFHEMNKTIFDRLEEYGIVVPAEDRLYRWFIVFDCEAMLKPLEGNQNNKLDWLTEHVPVSVSICSNVEGFQEPVCIIREDVNKLVKDMIGTMVEIGNAVKEAASEKWKDVFEMLRNAISTWSNSSGASAKKMTNSLKLLKKSLHEYCEQVPVLGFNSGRYDLNLLKGFIAQHLNMDDKDEARMTVKRNNNYTCISNKMFKFLDISNYLSAGTSYAHFLKAFGVSEAKGYFPYEYLTSFDKLEETSLPEHAAFHSSLKHKNITVDEYEYCQTVWKEKNMSTLRDFLEWYNNLDVGPFVAAVQELQKFYFERDIDIFKVCMSVPGIARNMLFRSAKEVGATFSLIGESDKDLHQTIKDNIVGGPSIIFNRHQKAGETYIRNDRNKPCKSVVGYDANALYLWALNQDLPCGSYIRRRQENDFRPERRDKYMIAFYWLEYMMEMTGHRILHKMNNGKEKRVGPYPVDGYCATTNTIFQFHGCYFHGHQCYMTKHVNDDEERLKRAERTKQSTEYLRAKGYNVVEMRECQYYDLRRNSQKLRDVIEKHMPGFYLKHPRQVTEATILKGILDESLFGMAEVNLEVPETWSPGFEQELKPYDYFEEMAPLFCTTDIPYSAIGKHMQGHVEMHNLSTQPRRLLVAGMRGERMLIATPLLKWYLEHGMLISKIHQVVEYTPMRCFNRFVEEVTEARRKGDSLSELKVLADTMKLIGNSAYGGLIMDKSKHRIISYAKGHSQASKFVNDTRFRNISQLDEDFYEVELAKAKIIHNLPIQLGYFILQYAKLRMLQFYYDFLDVYCDRSDFVYCEMDTDSAYMAISGDSLYDIIKPSMKHHYIKGLKGFCTETEVEADTGFHWFPRECCDKHAKMDKRTPGLFKLEFEGSEIISLCSKTYIVKSDRETKYSCKGVQRNNVEDPFEKYESVLKSGRSRDSVNKGFRAKNNTIFTYQQQRNGFNYFYCKREVLNNGIDTKVLDIVLTPEKKDKFDLKLADTMVQLLDS